MPASRPPLLAVLCLLALIGCHATPKASPPAAAHVDTVSELLVGTFDSRDQAARDPENYYEIRLVTIPIWPERTDGRWLYVEQASFSALDRPYRQRVYHLTSVEDGGVRSDVYELPGDPLAFAGAWTRPDDAFAGIGPEALALRDGCSIRLVPADGGGYTGATVGDGCPSSLGGAAYATSEVELRDGLLVSRDRGWDAEGVQVWGVTGDGYRFVRRSQDPPGAENPS